MYFWRKERAVLLQLEDTVPRLQGRVEGLEALVQILQQQSHTLQMGLLDVQQNHKFFLDSLQDRVGRLESSVATLQAQVATLMARFDQAEVGQWEHSQNLLERFYPRSSQDRPIRVLFLVVEISLWDAFRSVYDELAADPRFDPRVVVVPRQDVTAAVDYADMLAFFRQRGIDPVAAYDAERREWLPLAAQKPDCVFYTLGTVAFPEPYRIEHVSRYCRTCYLSYGFLMADVEDYQFNQSFHHAAWRIFASTERELERYRFYSKRLHSNVVLTGYPKFDFFLRPHPEVEASKLWRRPDSKKVIWAPHWTIAQVYPSLNVGNFHRYYLDMLTFLRENPDFEMLFKPHPNLLYAVEKAGLMSAEQYRDYCHEFASLPNGQVYVGGDYFPYFVTSDAMITDSLSFLAEYLPTGRPLLWTDRPDRARLSTVGEGLLQGYYQARDFAEVVSFLQEVVARGADPMSPERQKRMELYLGIGKEPSARRIKEVLVAEFLGEAAKESRPCAPSAAGR